MNPPDVIARHTDPETSHAAAANFDRNKAARSIQTVKRILAAGPMTDFQIREAWAAHWQGQWSFTLPSKARHWARQAGFVRHAGFAQHNGRKVRTWKLGTEVEPVKRPHKLGTLQQEIARLTAELAEAKRQLAKWGRPANATRLARSLNGEPELFR